MAQAGLFISDVGKTFTAVNDSTTTAIVAGDPVYFTTHNDSFGSSVSAARPLYSGTAVQVKSILCSASGYLYPAGVAVTDCPASTATVFSPVTVATEGIFMHPTKADVEAGGALMFSFAAEAKVRPYLGSTGLKVGRALTGGSADGKYILWRLNI